MLSISQYIEVLLGNPATRAGLAITLLLSFLLTRPIARRLGWSTFGTGLSFLGLGGAISVTLVNRLGSKDVFWDPAAVTECLIWTTRSWVTPEALLNLVLLVPLGLGIYLASHKVALSVAVIVATAVLIETLQAASGLGQCQPSDLIRNITGGLGGIALGWVIVRLFGTDQAGQRPPVRGHSR